MKDPYTEDSENLIYLWQTTVTLSGRVNLLPLTTEGRDQTRIIRCSLKLVLSLQNHSILFERRFLEVNSPVVSRHDPLHKLVEEGHREGCIAVIWTPDHPFDNQARSKGSQGVCGLTKD
jgi:hypothetical protein